METIEQILGDRSMLVKYLNRNTLFLATGDRPDAPVNEGSELTIHILDSVTGRHLFRHVHQVLQIDISMQCAREVRARVCNYVFLCVCVCL
jgi:hypothetical protein